MYTPNAKDDLSRLKLRHEHWDPAFLAYCKQLDKKKPVIFCGDLNVAHTELDLANPKPNRGKKGFTDEEREGFQNFVDAGFVDTFRIFTAGQRPLFLVEPFRQLARAQRGMENRLRAGVRSAEEESEGSEDPRRCAGQRSLPGEHQARYLSPSGLTADRLTFLYSPIWVNINPRQLDGVFNALCDPTRRAILARLTDADARVTDIAADFPDLAQLHLQAHPHARARRPAPPLHRRARPRARRSMPGRWPTPQAWIEKYRRFWEGRLAALEAYS